MRRSTRSPLRWYGALSVGLMPALAVAGGTAVTAEGGQAAARRLKPEEFKVVGRTVPSKVATLATVMPARIARIPAPEGSVVREGEFVVALEEGVQLARTQLAKANARSTLSIALARVRWEHAKREWNRLVRLHGNDYASSKELSDALADDRVTRLEYELALFEHEQAGKVHEREQKLLNEFHICAPFSGYVAEHLKHVGDTVDQLEGILTLVQLDPLQVVVDCPLALAPIIQTGDRYWVRPVDTRWAPRIATVVLASRVADGASQTFKVKLSVPNEGQAWLSGLKVVVDFVKDDALDAETLSEGSDLATVPGGLSDGDHPGCKTLP